MLLAGFADPVASAQESTETTRVKIGCAYRKHSDFRFQPARASQVAFASNLERKAVDEPIEIASVAGRAPASLTASVAIVSALALALASAVSAQPPFPPPGAAAPRSAREAARADLTGNWVAQVTEDWRWRMITPPKGDYASVPLNAEGRQVANGWDIARDAAAGEQCRAFGAGGITRQPTRLRVGWADAARQRRGSSRCRGCSS